MFFTIKCVSLCIIRTHSLRIKWRVLLFSCFVFGFLRLQMLGKNGKQITKNGFFFHSPFFHSTCSKNHVRCVQQITNVIVHDDNKTINFTALNVPFGIHDMLLAFSHSATHTWILILLSFAGSLSLPQPRLTIFVQSKLNRLYSLMAWYRWKVLLNSMAELITRRLMRYADACVKLLLFHLLVIAVVQKWI